MTLINNISNRFFLSGAYVKGYEGPLRIIEFSGPPGVGKSYLFRELIRTGFCFSKAIPRIATGLGFYYMRLDFVRKNLLTEAKLRRPSDVFVHKKIYLDQSLCRGKRLWVLDELLAQHLLSHFVKLSKHRDSLTLDFFHQRLVVIIVDDQTRILQKIKKRSTEQGRTWEGHRNKNDSDILSVIEGDLRAREKMYNELVKNGMNALYLNASDSVALNVAKIASAVGNCK